MAEITPPPGVVEKLKNQTGGINPTIDVLRTEHRLVVDFDDKTSLKIKCQDESLDEEILDLALEYLHSKVNIARSGRKSLGGQGTVVWTFKGEEAAIVDSLLKDDLKDLEDKEIIRKETTDVDSKQLRIFCDYDKYTSVKHIMEKIDEDLKLCIKTKSTKSVDLKDMQYAKKFVETRHNVFYCTLVKQDMTFYGKDKDNIQNGKDSWLKFKENGGKQKTEPEKTSPESTAKPAENKNSKVAANVKSVTVKEPEKSRDETPKIPQVMNHQWDDEHASDDYKQLSSANTESDFSETTNSKKTSSQSNSTKDTCKEETTGLYVTQPISPLEPSSKGTNDVRNDGIIYGTGDNKRYTFDCFGMKVSVYKASIVELDDVDAITNAANERLLHGAGVAYYISKAAGDKMNTECKDHISKNGTIPTTENFVSGAGKIKCKGIIHAVGPIWFDYKSKGDCAQDLYKTVINVLDAAKNKTWKSVALPAISSGIYGVPKQLCAEMYVKAFGEFGNNHGSLTDVHFVDINLEILDLVIDAHKLWVKDPSQLNFENALKYPASVASTTTTRGTKATTMVPKSTDDLIRFLGEDVTPYRARRFKYKFMEMVDVFVYTGDLLKLDTVDAIVVSLKPDLSGGVLADEVKKIGGNSYVQELRKQRSKNETVFICILTSKLKVIHVIYEPVRDVTGKSLQAFSEICRRIFTADYNASIQRIAMPLLGAASLTIQKDTDKLCQELMTQIITTLSIKQPTFRELHLVNLNDSITTLIQNNLKACTSGSYAARYDTKGKEEVYGYDDEERYLRDTKGWTEHKKLPDNETKQKKDMADHWKTDEGKPANNVLCPYHTEKQATCRLNCGNHAVCDICFISTKSCKSCPQSECPVCHDPVQDPRTLICGHTFCKDCFENIKKYKPVCPVCGHQFGLVTGTQPEGSMLYKSDKSLSLPGFETYGTIIIKYTINDGKQTKEHPHPGSWFKGLARVAFLPDNEDGKQVLHLLRRAFDRKLIFTIGESRTTGKEDVVTWNDIHHKTRIRGGSEKFGYPDPTYLLRVKEELAAKGVVN